MSLSWILVVYAALVGLVVGSFLNVVIYRLPRGLSTVRPRSRCPGCGTAIAPWDNVPLISFALLRGRCRSCGLPIPWRYPAIEALTGALFVVSLLRFGPTLDAVAGAVLSAILVALAAIDVEHFILPDRITLPGIALGFACSFGVGWTSPLASAIGTLLGGGILLALWGGWYLLRGEEGLGLGDVKMLAMVGAFLGWPGVLVTLFFGSLSGALVGIGLLASQRGGLKSRLPFGFFLALGAFLALFAGELIVRRYAALL